MLILLTIIDKSLLYNNNQRILKMKKPIFFSTIVLFSLFANAEVTISSLNDNPNINQSMPGVKIQNNLNINRNSDSSSNNSNNNSNDSFERATPPIASPNVPIGPNLPTSGTSGSAGPGIPGGMISVNPTVGGRTGYNAPVPKSYLDMENQNQRSSGQVPPTGLIIKPMTLQQWNQSTINEYTAQGQQNERELYQNFRRGQR